MQNTALYSKYTEFDRNPDLNRNPTFCPQLICENYFQLCETPQNAT